MPRRQNVSAWNDSQIGLGEIVAEAKQGLFRQAGDGVAEAALAPA
jgi:hypothetical protein